MPTTLTSASWPGRSTETRTSACAARWKTTSGRAASKTASAIADVARRAASRAVGDALALALREVVEDVHLVAAREQRVDDIRADEAAPPVTIARIAARILGAWASLLALEGIDGSGKGTQAARLAERRAAQGRSVASFSFPLYDGNPFSRAVADYLNGEFGTRRRGAPRARGAALRGRPLPRARRARRRRSRSTTSSSATATSRRTPRIRARSCRATTRRRLLDWLDEVEYGEFALPRPDLVVLLDAPVALARELVGAEGRPRLHDARGRHPRGRRRRTRRDARGLSRARASATTGGSSRTAGEDGALRDVDEIAGEIWAAWSRCSDDVRRDRRAGRGEAPARPPRSRKARRTRTSCTARPASASATLALLFAAELLGEHVRVERRTHPDLYVLEPLGDQIRIDDIRELRRDLHMRPFEAARRVYLVFGADTMNEDAADALLKDLEEPPAYAVILLVASDLGPLPETIRSRCQLVRSAGCRSARCARRSRTRAGADGARR